MSEPSIAPCQICLRLVTDLVLCEHGKEKDDGTRVEGERRAAGPTGSTASVNELAQRFQPKRACEGAATLGRGHDDMRECPHSQCGLSIRQDLVDHPFFGFAAACPLKAAAQAADAVDPHVDDSGKLPTRVPSPHSSSVIDQATALLKGWREKAAAIMAGRQNWMTSQQWNEETTRAALVMTCADELDPILTALLADLTAKDHAIATLTAENQALNTYRSRVIQTALESSQALETTPEEDGDSFPSTIRKRMARLHALEAEQARLTKVESPEALVRKIVNAVVEAATTSAADNAVRELLQQETFYYVPWKASYQQAARKLQAAEAALSRYGSHRPECRRSAFSSDPEQWNRISSPELLKVPCTCGFSALHGDSETTPTDGVETPVQPHRTDD